MPTYDAWFVDVNDGGYNHRILEADSPDEVIDYLSEQGHTEIEVIERS